MWPKSSRRIAKPDNFGITLRAAGGRRGGFALRRIALGALTTGLLLGLGAAPANAQNDPCPNEQLRTKQGSTHLPDCRAYELVSPGDAAYPIGSNASPQIELAASADGSRVSYLSVMPLPGSEGGGSGLAAERGSSEWTTISLLAPPSTNQWGNGFPGRDAKLLGTTPDQRTATYFDLTTEPHPSLWVRRSDGSRVRIADSSLSAFNTSPHAPHWSGWIPGMPAFQGISANGEHVIFVSREELIPGVEPTTDPSCESTYQFSIALPPATDDRCEILYEWVDDGSNGGNGTVRVVNLTNDPTPTLVESGAPATLGGEVPQTFETNTYAYGKHNAISADGSRIYFQAAAPAEVSERAGHPQGGGPVFLRSDGAETTEISAPEPGHTPDSAPDTYQYLTATPDGALAFFWADGDLTADAPTQGGIYRYDAEAGELGFVATAARLPENPQPLPTAVVSDDGSHLYFQDGGTLRLATGGTVRQVIDSIVTATRNVSGSPTPGLTTTGCPSADLSPDGRYLAFTIGSESNMQVHRYDAVADEVIHVSTSPAAPATYFAGFPRVGACSNDVLPARPIESSVMSDDGSRIFFVTAAALVPEDNNGRPDVYQWHDGEVSLISTGTSTGTWAAAGDLLMGADADGETVFFATTKRLVQADQNTEWNLYVARVNGGIPAQNQTPKTPCQGDECQGESSGAPEASDPGSAAAFPGNQPDLRRCQQLQNRAQRLGRRAKNQRQRAKSLRQRSRRQARSGNAKRAKALRQRSRRAQRSARQARQRSNRLRAQARQCRQAGSDQRRAR